MREGRRVRDTRATAHSGQNGPAEWASQHPLNPYSYWPRTAQTAQQPNPILVDKIGPRARIRDRLGEYA